MRQINAHLALLTHEVRSEALKKFDADVLKTDARRAMFAALDNMKNAKEVGEVADVSGQAALNMYKDEFIAPFLKLRTVGGSQIAEKDLTAIYQWFLTKSSR